MNIDIECPLTVLECQARLEGRFDAHLPGLFGRALRVATMARAPEILMLVFTRPHLRISGRFDGYKLTLDAAGTVDAPLLVRLWVIRFEGDLLETPGGCRLTGHVNSYKWLRRFMVGFFAFCELLVLISVLDGYNGPEVLPLPTVFMAGMAVAAILMTRYFDQLNVQISERLERELTTILEA